jgi:hypothetical protein
VNASDVKQALDRGAQLLRERERGTEKKRNYIRLSSAGACVRQLYLLESGEAEAEPLSAETLRIFDVGTTRGVGMAEAIEAGLSGPDGKDPCEWFFHAEGTVLLSVEGVSVPGHTDLLAESLLGWRVLYEFKTMNPYAWKRLDEGDARSIGEQYRAQLGCYWQALDQPEQAFFVAEDKGTSQHKVIEVPRDVLEEGAKAGSENLAAAIRAVREKRKPERPYPAKASGELEWPCRYCSVADACWEGKITRHSKSKWTVPT